MTYIVNCALSYLFADIRSCVTINCNATPGITARALNKFSGKLFVPENMQAYNKLVDAQNVIFFADTKKFLSRCENIEKFSPQSANLNLYFWNPLCYYEDSIKSVSCRWRIWSFSKQESEKYHMLYAETFYNKDLVLSSPIKTDVFFVGLDKGRKQILDRIKDVSRQSGLVADINIVDSVKALYNTNYSSKIPYEEVRRRVARTLGLIDIVQSGQTGLTQRVVESLFFKKKLITNNKMIMEAPFYSSDNIFVIGKDSFDNLAEFVRSPYVEVTFDIEEYNIRRWLSRMIEGKCFNER